MCKQNGKQNGLASVLVGLTVYLPQTNGWILPKILGWFNAQEKEKGNRTWHVSY